MAWFRAWIKRIVREVVEEVLEDPEYTELVGKRERDRRQTIIDNENLNYIRDMNKGLL